MTQKLLAPESISVACKLTGRFGFAFGRRFFLLLLVGVLWAVPAFWESRFLLIMAAWDLCAIAGWAMDLRHLPRPERIKLERSWTGAAILEGFPARRFRCRRG